MRENEELRGYFEIEKTISIYLNLILKDNYYEVEAGERPGGREGKAIADFGLRIADCLKN